MSKVPWKEEVLKTDVLCIGGGIAGLMAAIRARESGAGVIVAEKGNVLYSGRGRGGNDHFWCYIPEVHGSDVDSFMAECLKGPKLRVIQSGTSRKVLRTFLQRSFEIVELWDRWGIPMKYQGRWEFSGHSFPGGVFTHLKYEGKEQKRILTEKAIEKGVKIVNRVMILDLLRDGDTVTGALGVHTRERKLIVFSAKKTIMATGAIDRLFPSPVPAWMGSTPYCLTVTGDGRAMTYRAGGTIVGPEIPKRHMGPRYFARCGQATWVGVLRDPQGNPIGPFVTKPDRRYGDMTMEVSSTILEDYLKSGHGPVYMDCRGISDEDYGYMMHWLVHEGNGSVLDHMAAEGVDVRQNPVEFGTYHMMPEAKIRIDERAETTVKGLLAAGDEAMFSIGPASTYGWIAGERASECVRKTADPDPDGSRPLIEARKEQLQKIEQRRNGPDWRETNVALQQLMHDYCGSVRSENLLSAGQNYLARLKEKAINGLTARNSWELVRCLEVLNLCDIAELVFLAAQERKETRGLHKRSDFPLTNPVLEGKALLVRKSDGRAVLEWKKIE